MPEDEARRAGLCASCAHARVQRSARGSVFYRCALSERDPDFPRYPALPVLACAGHEPADRGLRG
jgi:hypothetical protein